LTIARAIVDAHGGKIWMESIPGQGTSAHFTIPIAGAGERADPPADAIVAERMI
jgi:signal transduction histidine kinase